MTQAYRPAGRPLTASEIARARAEQARVPGASLAAPYATPIFARGTKAERQARGPVGKLRRIGVGEFLPSVVPVLPFVNTCPPFYLPIPGTNQCVWDYGNGPIPGTGTTPPPPPGIVKPENGVCPAGQMNIAGYCIPSLVQSSNCAAGSVSIFGLCFSPGSFLPGTAPPPPIDACPGGITIAGVCVPAILPDIAGVAPPPGFVSALLTAGTTLASVLSQLPPGMIPAGVNPIGVLIPAILNKLPFGSIPPGLLPVGIQAPGFDPALLPPPANACQGGQVPTGPQGYCVCPNDQVIGPDGITCQCPPGSVQQPDGTCAPTPVIVTKCPNGQVPDAHNQCPGGPVVAPCPDPSQVRSPVDGTCYVIGSVGPCPNGQVMQPSGYCDCPSGSTLGQGGVCVANGAAAAAPSGSNGLLWGLAALAAVGVGYAVLSKPSQAAMHGHRPSGHGHGGGRATALSRLRHARAGGRHASAQHAISAGAFPVGHPQHGADILGR